jgi:tetratricopeptide (TPR) repeat protein
MLANDMEQYDRAEIIYREVLEVRRNSLGPGHADTLDVLDDLAELYKLCRNFAKAEEYYLKAIDGLEKSLGASHHQTTASRVRFSRMLANDMEQYDRAESIYREVLEVRQNSLGPEHANTLDVINYLGSLLEKSNRREAALELLRTRAALSDRAEDGVRYNLACYECLEGDLDEAKRLIANHLKAHPELKEQALADSDFAAIRDFIEAL